MKNLFYDVVVIGGGHAGCEAAAASARIGASTLLITKEVDKIGEMSCNPAIGGLGKGHLVREIDSLDGIMGKAIDKSGIQFRMLNLSRGPAVHGPRAQADRTLYKTEIKNLLSQYNNLKILEDSVDDLIIENFSVTGIKTSRNKKIFLKSVVLTTGTFLGGIIHVGSDRIPAGRIGEKPSNKLANNLRKRGIKTARLKTGTPARLDKKSINFQDLEVQHADKFPVPFSYLTKEIDIPQISCFITRTNNETHKIISESSHLSSIFSGQIEGIGPRYCPSIEDKITRFVEKNSHQIFLEPEGLNSDVIYPNGISTSLPKNIQEKFIRTIKGLENVNIIQYGYAIEYDYVDPRSLTETLELNSIKGLFLAGQINGTTGYEEAAAQGLIAGTNAALKVNGENQKFVLNRGEAYIGVMIDDLISKGAPEPYRMFTSRAEYRLHLRADNADQRLTEKGNKYGLISHQRINLWRKKKKDLKFAYKILDLEVIKNSDLKKHNLPISRNGKLKTPRRLLSNDLVKLFDCIKIFPELKKIPKYLHKQIEADCKYSNYLERQKREIVSLRKDFNIDIPKSINYKKIGGLSSESIELLSKNRPLNVLRASKIPGITPAAVLCIIRFLKKENYTREKLEFNEFKYSSN